MSFSFCSLASGSSGNCYLIKSDETALLVDAGIAGKRIVVGLEACGVEPCDVKGILVTHEHSDHMKNIKMAAKLCGEAWIHGTAGTLNAISYSAPAGRMRAFGLEEKPFMLGDILVEPFPLSHDAAEPAGYAFVHEGKRIAILTDTGYVTDRQFASITEADIMAIEANHEVNVLMMGEYPYHLKKRILGEEGHLSNEAAACCIAACLENRTNTRIPHVVLSHLSNENNSPDMARITVKNLLLEGDKLDGRDYYLYVARRDGPGDMISI